MRVSQLLERGLALIEDQAHWCQGSMARDADGREIGALSPHAVRFCSVGALFRTRRTRHGQARDLLDDLAARRQWGADSLEEFNDSNGHAEVIALWQDAVRTAKQREALPIKIPHKNPAPARPRHAKPRGQQSKGAIARACSRVIERAR